MLGKNAGGLVHGLCIMCGRFGSLTVTDAFAAILKGAADELKAAIAKLPEGTSAAEGFLDSAVLSAVHFGTGLHGTSPVGDDPCGVGTEKGHGSPDSGSPAPSCPLPADQFRSTDAV